MTFVLPPLKRPPRLVVLLHWPRDGEDWIHPEDRCLASVLLPSDRVFVWEDSEGPYDVLSYGHRVLRVEPAMRLEVPDEGLRIDDQVEVLSRMGKNWPQIGFIREARWSETQQVIWYQIRVRDRVYPARYRADDLRRIEYFDRSAVEL